MSGQFIEIQSDGVSLRKAAGFLWIQNRSAGSDCDRKIPLDQIEGILIQAKGVSITKSVLLEVASRGIPTVLTDGRHLPMASVTCYSGSHRTAEILRLQASAKLPTTKSAWKDIVKGKITNQAKVLLHVSGDPILMEFPRTVRSGDATNREGVAAKFYWTRLFGTGFRRDPQSPGLNGILNYGYSVLRSAMAKHVAAAGLSPALGIFHHGSRNPFQLVDDLIEPFRPAVDLIAKRACQRELTRLSPSMKKTFVNLFFEPVFKNQEWGRTLSGALQKSVYSFLAKLEDPGVVYRPCPENLFPALFEVDRKGAWFS